MAPASPGPQAQLKLFRPLRTPSSVLRQNGQTLPQDCFTQHRDFFILLDYIFWANGYKLAILYRPYLRDRHSSGRALPVLTTAVLKLRLSGAPLTAVAIQRAKGGRRHLLPGKGVVQVVQQVLKGRVVVQAQVRQLKKPQRLEPKPRLGQG